MGEYPSLCVRNMHAVRTQCTRSAHAVQTLSLGSSEWVSDADIPVHKKETEVSAAEKLGGALGAKVKPPHSNSMGTKRAPRKILSCLHPNTILKPNLDSNAHPPPSAYS